MKLSALSALVAFAVTTFVVSAAFDLSAQSVVEQNNGAKTDTPRKDLPATVEEARARAQLLHETIHGVLQVMHRDFFDEDNGRKIPSASLEDVFKELAQSQGVEVRWLGVEGKTMGVDHEPRDEFENNAVKALSSGKREYEALENDRYRRVGVIVLHNTCLKCHVPNRTSLEDRAAGLVISMSLKKNRLNEKK